MEKIPYLQVCWAPENSYCKVHTSAPINEQLYTNLVRPHLDYATAAWDPYTVKNIKDLEKVQNAAARSILNLFIYLFIYSPLHT